MFVTNQPQIVNCAKKSYAEFPTVVNKLEESGITYDNTKRAYAEMDNKLSKAQRAIGESSNLAQLCVTYYCTELQKDNPDKKLLKEYYDNFVILAVLAQIAIDGCKREYEVTASMEIDRIKKMDCMKIYEGNNFPLFMQYTKEVKVTKNGKPKEYCEIKKEKDKIKDKINEDLICPMNWLQDILNKIQSISNANTTPTKNFFIKMNGTANHKQMSKIRKIIEDYDFFIIKNSDLLDNEEGIYYILEETENVINQIKSIKINNIVTINRLVEVCLGIDENTGGISYKKSTKYTRKMLNILYKSNKDKFLLCFSC